MPVAVLHEPPSVPRSLTVYICAKQVLAANSSKQLPMKSVMILFMGAYLFQLKGIELGAWEPASRRTAAFF